VYDKTRTLRHRLTTMNVEKRGHVRVKVSVPIELTPEGSETPLRTETADLSATGCYIETLFTLAVSTKLQITLYAGASTILTTAKIVTRDPNVDRMRAGSSAGERGVDRLAFSFLL
jgi:c-di-GMP-binding flagellar brake protein YcgR